MKNDYKYVLLIISILFVFIPLKWGNATTTGILFPLSESLSNINISGFSVIFSLEKIADIAKSMITGLMLYQVYLLLFAKSKR